jgi:tetratricopeptide (TPR) repeat protein
MDLTYFNPNSQKESDFLMGFVARQRTLDFFLKQLRLVPASGAARHHLIVAPRGFGKTSLLRRIAIGVQTDQQLNTSFIALRFREEQHNVISLDVFWRNCLQSLAEAREDEKASPDEIATLDAAWGTHAPRQALTQEEQDGEPAWQVLRAYCEQLQRRPLLLIDNLDTLLAGLSSHHQWGLRKRLQSDDGPVLIAAASRYPAATHDQAAAFYEFFRIHPLDKLNDQEVFACLRNLAVHRGAAGKPVLTLLDKDPGRVVALNTMAGGNPRTLSVLYSVLESHMSADVLSQLSAMLDTFTGWYQARTEELPIQARAVFDALALNWDPMTAAALGSATGLDTPVVSSQLTRLEKAGYVEPVALSKRGKGRSGYQVSERFFNIWYLMRNGPRRARQSIFFLTKFLQSCFSSAERRSHALSVLESGQSNPSYTLALAGSFSGGRLRQQLLEQADIRSNHNGQKGEYESIINELRNEGQRQSSAVARKPEKVEQLIRSYDDIIVRFGAATEPALRERVAKALYNKGLRLGVLGQPKQEIAVYDDIVARFGAATEPNLRGRVAMALFNKGYTLGVLGQSEQEIAAYDDVVARFGAAIEPALREQVVMALVNKGLTLDILGQSEHAIAVYDDVVARFGTATEPALREKAAKALVIKGYRLGDLGQSEQAISAYDDVVARFGADTKLSVREQVAKALFNKAFRLGELGQSEPEIAAYDEVVARFGAATEPVLREQVSKALVNKGYRLGLLGQSEQEMAAYDNVVARFGAAAEPALLERVAMALVNKGYRLGLLGQSEQEIATYDDVIARFGAATEPALLERVAMALFSKGLRLGTLGQSAQEIAAYDDVVARFGAATEPALREQVAMALFSKGLRLGTLGQSAQEIAAYDDVVAHFGAATEPTLRGRVAMALFNKGYRLGDLGQSEQEIAAYDDVVARYGSVTEPALREQVAMALLSKGSRLGVLGQSEQAITVYDDVVIRFGAATEPTLREKVAMALLSKGSRLDVLGQSEQEIAAYDDIVIRFGTAIEPTLRERVAMALVNKGYRLGVIDQSEQAIAAYDEVVARFGAAAEPALREQVVMALGGKAFLLCKVERFDASKAAYRDAIKWDSTVSQFHVSLGNLLLDFTGEISSALAVFQSGLEAVTNPKDRVLLHANVAYAIALHDGDRLVARMHANSALKDETGISPAGRRLLEALPIWSERTGSDWPNVFQHIGKALTSEDPALWTNYIDDLQRILWFVLANGQGADFKRWMEDEQFKNRYAPLYHAFVAVLEGEDHLLQINPETRQPAQVIYAGIVRRVKLWPSQKEKKGH